MTQMIRTGLIGFGSLGKRRAAAMAEQGNCTLVAVADCNPNAEADCTTSFYTDWKAMLEQEQLDAVFICATNDVLCDATCAALEKGLHVFCEKPPGRTVAEIEAMRAAEKQSGKILKHGFNHRYHRSVMACLEQLQTGELGALQWIRGVYGKSGGHAYEKDWRNNPTLSGGGILIDQGIHMLDLMRLFAGELELVQALRSKAYWDTPVEDNAMLLLQSPEGAIAQLHSSATQWQHRFRLELGLEKGLLSLEGILSGSGSYAIDRKEQLIIQKTTYDEAGYPQPNPKAELIEYADDPSWVLEIEEFSKAIIHKAPISHGHSGDALRIMQLIESAYHRPLFHCTEPASTEKRVAQ